MQKMLIITGIVFSVSLSVGCKLQPVSEEQNIGRTGKGLLEIADVSGAINKAVAKYKVHGKVDELAAFIKSTRHHPDDIAAAIAAFKKIVKDQANVVKGRINQLTSKLGNENVHIDLNARNVNWIAIMGERRANLDSINDALAKLIKEFDQHKAASIAIAGIDGKLLQRLSVGFDNIEWSKALREDLSVRKVMNVSPPANTAKKRVKDAQDAVAAKLNHLDKVLNETFVTPLKNAFASAAQNADFARVRHIIETGVENGQAHRMKSYFRRLFDINSTAPTAYYRSYTQKIATGIEAVVLNQIPHAKSTKELAQLLDGVSSGLDSFGKNIKARAATLQQIDAAEGSTDFLKNITDDLHLVKNSKLNKLSNMRNTPLGGTHYRNNSWPATLEYNLTSAIAPSLKKRANEYSSALDSARKKIVELQRLCKQTAC